MLRKNPNADIRVFVVWEPVLATDWNNPGPAITSNIPDARARHYWDPDRILSALYGGPAAVPSLASALTVNFRLKDVIWDTLLLYPPGAKWPSKATSLYAPVVARFRPPDR